MKAVGAATATLALWMSSCASNDWQSLDWSATSEPRPHTIIVGVSRSPGFMATTVASGLFGAAGVAVQTAAGEHIIKRNEIADPAGGLGKVLATALARR